MIIEWNNKINVVRLISGELDRHCFPSQKIEDLPTVFFSSFSCFELLPDESSYNTLDLLRLCFFAISNIVIKNKVFAAF